MLVCIAFDGDEHDMGDVDPRETFGYALGNLVNVKLRSFLPREYLADDSISEYMKERSNGVHHIANMKLSREGTIELLHSGKADAVSFGKAYIANPDLYERLIADTSL